jgi:hypothetical protein
MLLPIFDGILLVLLRLLYHFRHDNFYIRIQTIVSKSFKYVKYLTYWSYSVGEKIILLVVCFLLMVVQCSKSFIGANQNILSNCHPESNVFNAVPDPEFFMNADPGPGL